MVDPHTSPAESRCTLSIATPRGRGGLALLTLRGPGAGALLARVTDAVAPPRRDGRLSLTPLVSDGVLLDEALIARIDERFFEIGIHAGPAVLEAVVDGLRAAGATLIPEELDGLSLLARQARALFPRALSNDAAKLLMRALNGELEARLKQLRELLSSDGSVAAARHELDALLAGYPLARALLNPPTVAIIGAPNAGKSSLFNALTGERRALISSDAGTTRDYLEARAQIGGLTLHLIDTAGLRYTEDHIESQGITLGRASASQADARLLVFDASAPHALEAALAERPAPPFVLVANKLDLVASSARAALTARLESLELEAPLHTSCALTGEGLEPLAETLRRLLTADAPHESARGACIFTELQARALEQAQRALAAGGAEDASSAISSLLE
jgi:tRNA modification GTPase